MNLENARSNSSIALEKLRLLVHQHGQDTEWRFPPERDLAASMGLGRRAVRRAMEVLEAEGLVWRQQGKGTFLGSRPVLEPQFFGNLADRTNPLEVMEARLQIEPALARMAALRCTGDDIAALERLSKKTVTSSDDDGWELWDSAFHRRIAECAGNGLMLALFDITQRIRQDPDWRRPRALARTPARRERSYRHHEEIVRALASRDGAAAERAMRHHLSVLNADLQAIMHGADEAASADPASGRVAGE
ncbi:FadR/GntR family transcriptional regulator [Nitratireductor soli]|uniref:FadR/GntR family transcriptional regulator n=1 Tax=Nitratireductor soli TaxID=1670619 RepID=UPI00065E3547|nr:FCD domain-containing protein [Nitratireductor soli]